MKLATALNDIIPVQWEKVLLYSEVEEGAVTQFFYFLESSSNSYIQGGDIYEKYDVSRKEYIVFVSETSDIITDWHKDYSEKAGSSWTTMTFYLDSNGKFKADYGYEDLTKITLDERRSHWEKENLDA